jgi:hypothetical protein
MSKTILLKASIFIFALFILGFTACLQPGDDDLTDITNKYTVTFEADGGSPAPAAQTVDEGGNANEPPLMVKSGYQFNGWYDNVQLIGSPWDFDTGIITADIILYARWITFRAVTEISGVTTAAVQGSAAVLTGTVEPANATNRTIIWTVKSGSAAISDGNRLTASASGTVIVTATITNGKTPGEDYTKDVTIDVWASSDPRVAFVGRWFAQRGTTGNPYDSTITMTADKFEQNDTWGAYFDIIELVWTAATNGDSGTQTDYPSGYTITGNILRRGSSNGEIFSGATSITMYLTVDKQRFIIPAWESINTGSRYTKQ